MPCKPMTFNEQQWCDVRGGCVCVYYDPNNIGFHGQPCVWRTRLRNGSLGIGYKPCPSTAGDGVCYFNPCPPNVDRPCYTRPIPVACDDPRCNVGPCSGRTPYRPPPSTVPLPPPQPPSGGGSGAVFPIEGGSGGLSRTCGYGPNPCSFGRTTQGCRPDGSCPPRPGDAGIRVCCR